MNALIYAALAVVSLMNVTDANLESVENIFSIIEEVSVVDICPEIDEETVDLLARTIYAEARGLQTMEQAAVGWCVLNRVDAGYGTVKEVLTAPYQFASYNGDLHSEQLKIANDVLVRWHLEAHTGVESVYRVLPSEYLWFTGDGSHNHFRDSYDGGNYWNWDCVNPYI